MIVIYLFFIYFLSFTIVVSSIFESYIVGNNNSLFIKLKSEEIMAIFDSK